MKIAVLLSRLDQTGMTTNTIDLCESLSTKGYKVDLIVGGYNNTDSNLRYLKNRIGKSSIIIISFPHKYALITINKFYNIYGLLKVLLLFSYKKYDIIHVESPYLSFLPWLLRKKFVSTMHVPDLENIFAYKNASRVIAISKETQKYCIDKFNYKPDQIDLVYHGVDNRFGVTSTSKEIDILKSKLRIEPNKIIIGIVASIEKRKGHDILIKSIELLDPELRKNVVLIILGSYKVKSSGWLEGLIENSPIQKQIIWEQYQDPKLYYDMMDVFVLPSRLEGFPLVALEAMLSNCVVIRSNTEGAEEQIVDGVNGFIFKNENETDLSRILSSLIVDSDLRTKIAYDSKKYALSHFTQEVMAENTLNVYRKICL